jgi:hypothetical protein
MTRPAFETEIVDRAVRDRTVALFRERRIVLPTLDRAGRARHHPRRPSTALAAVDPDAPAPANLFASTGTTARPPLARGGARSRGACRRR